MVVTQKLQYSARSKVLIGIVYVVSARTSIAPTSTYTDKFASCMLFEHK